MRTWRVCINVTYLMKESSCEDMEGMYQCHLHNEGKFLQGHGGYVSMSPT